jgi:hypothetical protein
MDEAKTALLNLPRTSQSPTDSTTRPNSTLLNKSRLSPLLASADFAAKSSLNRWCDVQVNRSSQLSRSDYKVRKKSASPSRKQSEVISRACKPLIARRSSHIGPTMLQMVSSKPLEQGLGPFALSCEEENPLQVSILELEQKPLEPLQGKCSDGRVLSRLLQPSG